MTQETFLGYSVKKLSNNGCKAAYRLLSNRATYTLWGCHNDDHLMFALNSNYRVCEIKGYKNFSDQEDILKPVKLFSKRG